MSVATETEPKKPGRAFRSIVSLGIIAYATAVALQITPSTPLRDRLVPYVMPFLDYTGTWQNFAVFAPNPRDENIYISAIVTFADGSTQYFAYPRLDRLNYFDRMQKERFRKYALDNAYKDTDRGVWPDLARYIARTSARAGAVPISVSLQRHWSDIPPPQKGVGKPLPENSQQLTFFVYTVSPEDLE